MQMNRPALDRCSICEISLNLLLDTRYWPGNLDKSQRPITAKPAAPIGCDASRVEEMRFNDLILNIKTRKAEDVQKIQPKGGGVPRCINPFFHVRTKPRSRLLQ
jgi:hypothetical protein